MFSLNVEQVFKTAIFIVYDFLWNHFFVIYLSFILIHRGNEIMENESLWKDGKTSINVIYLFKSYVKHTFSHDQYVVKTNIEGQRREAA